MYAAADYIYMIEPPNELYANPTMTPFGGIFSNSRDPVNLGRPRYYFNVFGVMILSYCILVTYLRAVLLNILFVSLTKFLIPAYLQYPSIKEYVASSVNFI